MINDDKRHRYKGTEVLYLLSFFNQVSFLAVTGLVLNNI
jgi:hypothetical protein